MKVIPVELVHLECFVTLAEELHFGRTGTRLHLGGPAVTKRISELERQLGVQLFARTSRQVSLTPAGEALIGPAQRALAEIGAFRAIAGDAAAGMVGAARAAYSPGTGEMITVLTRELKRRTPSVTVHPAQMVSVRVASAVRSRRGRGRHRPDPTRTGPGQPGVGRQPLHHGGPAGVASTRRARSGVARGSCRRERPRTVSIVGWWS